MVSWPQSFPIKGFGTKLMVASKSINNIPQEYLSYARNARIYDGGIWPRLGKQLLTNSVLGTVNRGWFVMNGSLYQIANSNVYLIDPVTGVQTSKGSLGYDATTDILLYDYKIETWTTLWSQSNPFTYTKPVNKIKFVYSTQNILLYAPDDSLIDSINISNSNTGKYRANVKILNTTTNYQSLGTWTTATDWYILEDWQFIYLFPSDVPVVANIAARNALYPSPTGWERVYRQDVTAFDLFTAWSPWSWGTQALWMSGTINLSSWYYVITQGNKALIASSWQQLQVFDGSSLFIPTTQPWSDSGFLEYCRGYSFLASGNVLYISKPITATSPENAYNFTDSWSQNITFDTTISGLKGTLDWLYVFTENQVHLIDANSLQNVAWSATFISRPLGDGSAPLNNLCIAASGNKIFYITKSLHVNTINYIQYTSDSTIWELSARPVIGIKEFLNTVSTTQPTAFAFYNGKDKTIQMHIRPNGVGFNQYCLVYDLVNDTWNVDTGKNYNYVAKNWDTIYGFSDVNTSIYQDDTGFSDAWTPIDFHIKTQSLNQGTINQKIYHGFMVAGGIWNLSELEFIVNVDDQSIFQDTVSGLTNPLPDIGEIWWGAIWDDLIWWNLVYDSVLTPFDRVADEGRIYTSWKRIQIEILCQSQIQDFILDLLWIVAEGTWFTDISDKF